MIPGLFDKRLLVVVGKGGVGRTTLTAALGLAAARAGKRVCLVELHGVSDLPPLFGLTGRSYAPRAVAPGVDAMSLTANEAIDDFGRRKLAVFALVRLVLHARVTRAFIDAVPGMHDLVQLGKVENMLMEPLESDTKYDLVILDAPATGHGLTLLAAARAMSEITRVGPFHDLAEIIGAFLSDRARTAAVLATLPEELPVHEAIELLVAMGEESTTVGAILANGVHPRVLPDSPPWAEVRSALGSHPEAVTWLDAVAAREADQAEALLALTTAAAGFGVPVAEIPLLPGIPGPTPTAVAHALAAALGRSP